MILRRKQRSVSARPKCMQRLPWNSYEFMSLLLGKSAAQEGGSGMRKGWSPPSGNSQFLIAESSMTQHGRDLGSWNGLGRD